jgi:hypothetical protein
MKRPQYLYKYVPYSSAHLDDLLCGSSLHFSRPGDFNDPSDCMVRYTFDAGNAADLESWHKTALIALVNHDPRYAGGPDLKLFEEYLRRYPKPDHALKAAAGPVLRADIKHKLIGVLCLTETCTDPVMYYHYCKNHHGVCVRFTVRDGSYFPHAEPVTYHDKYPVVDFFESSKLEKQFETIFLRKYSGWAYEKEWRIIDFIDGPGARSYPADLLSGIVFGMNTTDAERARVIGCLRKRDHSVEMMQAELSEDSYQMKVAGIGYTR